MAPIVTRNPNKSKSNNNSSILRGLKLTKAPMKLASHEVAVTNKATSMIEGTSIHLMPGNPEINVKIVAKLLHGPI